MTMAQIMQQGPHKFCPQAAKRQSWNLQVWEALHQVLHFTTEITEFHSGVTWFCLCPQNTVWQHDRTTIRTPEVHFFFDVIPQQYGHFGPLIQTWLVLAALRGWSQLRLQTEGQWATSRKGNQIYSSDSHQAKKILAKSGGSYARFFRNGGRKTSRQCRSRTEFMSKLTSVELWKGRPTVWHGLLQ